MRIERNILVDGNNLLHRANAIFVKNRIDDPMFHKGYPTGLIYGTFSMLTDWVAEIPSPTHASLFLDGVPARRRKLDPNYKVKETDTVIWDKGPVIKLSDGFEAISTIEIIRHLASLLGMDIFHDSNEEADDLIASFVQYHHDDINIIISSDVDFYQLLDHRNTVIIFRPGVKGSRFFDAERASEDMIQRHKIKTKASIPPAAIRMFKSFTGDTSDKIIGVPFLRKKVVVPLCLCGSVDEFYATGLPGFSKKEKEKSLALKDRIKLNYELVGLVNDINIESMRIPPKCDVELAETILREDLGITSIPVRIFSFNNPKMHISDAPSDIFLDPAYDWMKGI